MSSRCSSTTTWSWPRNSPPATRADHDQRFGRDGHHVYSAATAAHTIHTLLTDYHIVGVNPSFDDAMLRRLLKRAGDLEPSWSFHLIDLATLTLGYLTATTGHIQIPWHSDTLAAKVMPMTTVDGAPLIWG